MGTFKVFAIKYATRNAIASEHFYKANCDENYPMPMDYFVWVVQSKELTILIDTGFNQETSKKRNRQFIKDPVESLKDLNIHPDDVDYVIITHFHYDHIGNIDRFKNAKFIVQEREMEFWTGRYASKGSFISHIEQNDIIDLIKRNFEGRVLFVSGDVEVFSGITLYLVGGHSAGLQMVEIKTENGQVLLTSDVAHFYKNFEHERPFQIIDNLPQMYYGFELIKRLSHKCIHVVPGHDPKIMELFNSVNGETKQLIVEIG